VTKVDWRDEGVYPDHMFVYVDLNVEAANFEVISKEIGSFRQLETSAHATVER
jgi:hypothetical protein